MTQQTLNIILWVAPVVAGGIIAAINSNQTNDWTESVEAWIRKQQKRTAGGRGWFSSYILNPILWLFVKFSDWTDGFTHRGLKNGTRVAGTLYLTAAWLLILYVAFMVVVALVVIGVILYIAAKVLGGSNDSNNDSERGDEKVRHEDVVDRVGMRGKKVYSGTNWFNEELKGRVDDEGNIYKGTNWFNEEKIGRIDGDGTIYQGTNWTNETKVGRIDGDGNLHKGTNWFNEEKTGRIDEDGNVHKGTNWFNEKKQGRTGD